MNQYMVLLYGGFEATQRLSPEESQTHMLQWRAWFQALIEKGLLVGGQPLGHEGKVLSGPEGHVVKDGPFAEGKEAVAGYVMLRAETLEEAAETARGCPGLGVGMALEVRKLLAMP